MEFFLIYKFKLKFVPMKVFGYINSGTNLRLVEPGVIFLTDQILLLLFPSLEA
jgi:hypothetical protein